MQKAAGMMQSQVLPQLEVMQHKNKAFVTRVLVLCGLFYALPDRRAEGNTDLAIQAVVAPALVLSPEET